MSAFSPSYLLASLWAQDISTCCSQSLECSWVLAVCLVAQSCLTLGDPMDCSPQGSSVHGILQARILEWVAISFSRASSQPRNRTQASCIIGRFFYQLSRKGDKWRQLKDIFIKQELEKDPRKTVTWKSSPTNCGILKYFKLKSRRVISVNVWVQY